MLSEVDRKILRTLQKDGRITNQELASRCGLSPSACLDRVKKLREQEYITEIVARLDPVTCSSSLPRRSGGCPRSSNAIWSPAGSTIC